MATTAYDAAVAYDAALRYDGVYTPSTPAATPELFGPPLKKRREPEQRRTISSTHTTRSTWVIEPEVIYVDDEMILLGLI